MTDKHDERRASTPAPDPNLDSAVAAESRTPAYRARDPYRHAGATLKFYGLKPDQTVVEVWPSRGWYTEVLAPYLRERDVEGIESLFHQMYRCEHRIETVDTQPHVGTEVEILERLPADGEFGGRVRPADPGRAHRRA